MIIERVKRERESEKDESETELVRMGEMRNKVFVASNSDLLDFSRNDDSCYFLSQQQYSKNKREREREREREGERKEGERREVTVMRERRVAKRT